MVRRALALFAFCASAAAQSPSPGAASPAGDELKNIRQMLEQQSQQLDVLAQEVARLNLLLQNRSAAETTPPGATENAAIRAPAAPPVSSPPAPPAPVAPASSPPVPAGLTHEVTKGETLTSIAKHYKVTVAELLKINKITDVRKLQIGQSLTLPPNAKPQESPNPPPN